MLALLDLIAIIAVYTLGIGCILYAIAWIYVRLFDYVLSVLQIKKEFLHWFYEKNKPKVSTPKIKREKDD